jgi:hypothetical protein
MKTTQKERGRLMGLDVGDKYVGLALSDFDNKIASPFRYHNLICLHSVCKNEGFNIFHK